MYFFRAVLVLLLLIPCIHFAYASERPKQVSSWGFMVRDAAGGQGLSVVAIKHGSPAEKAGLRPGDILLSINGVAVHSAQSSGLKKGFSVYAFDPGGQAE